MASSLAKVSNLTGTGVMACMTGMSLTITTEGCIILNLLMIITLAITSGARIERTRLKNIHERTWYQEIDIENPTSVILTITLTYFQITKTDTLKITGWTSKKSGQTGDMRRDTQFNQMNTRAHTIWAHQTHIIGTKIEGNQAMSTNNSSIATIQTLFLDLKRFLDRFRGLKMK